MVYDSKNQLIVLFGGDAQDRALADTWVFDVKIQTWAERKPPVSPYPRSCHGLAFLQKSGVVLLVGGKAVADYRDVKRLSNQVWVYDAGKNRWSPVDVEIPEKRPHRLEDDLDRRRRQVRKCLGDFRQFVVRGAECAAF